MTVRETPIFIHKPAAEIVRTYRHGDAPKEVRADNEVAYLFNGESLETAEFGLTSDFDAPKGSEWTQLLHREPGNAAALAETLLLLGIDLKQLHPATDWEGNPLIDLAPIGELLRKRSAAPANASYLSERRASVQTITEKAKMATVRPNKKTPRNGETSSRPRRAGFNRGGSKNTR